MSMTHAMSAVYPFDPCTPSCAHARVLFRFVYGVREWTGMEIILA